MKCLLIFILLLPLLIIQKITHGTSAAEDQKNNPEQKAASSLTILSSPEIYPLTRAWGDEFKKLNSGLEIRIGNFDLQNAPIEKDNIYLLSESDYKSVKDSLWRMVVGRDAIVPVINAKNPLLEKILIQGITSGKLKQLMAEANQQWGKLIPGGENIPIHVYIMSNPLIVEKVANFSQSSFQTVKENFIVEEGNIIPSVLSDQYAVGFCFLADVLNNSTNQFTEGIRLLPVDKNSNGRIDYFENIYSSPDVFTRGVWIGKYPKQLCGNVYAAASLKPSDPKALEFLTWIQTGGQKLLHLKGYSELASSERNINIEELAKGKILPTSTVTARPWLSIIILVFSALIVWLLINLILKRKIGVALENVENTPVLKQFSLAAPKGLYFDKSHTWTFMEKEGVVKMGIDDFLQHVTGELTHITMKNPGVNVRKGEKIFSISHNGKKLEIHSPISGTIIQKNRNLMIDSTLLNSSPYSDGWIYEIEPKNWLKEIRFLLMGENYFEWLENEITRLKDFFAETLKSHKQEFSPVILQDGGEILDHVLADLEPRVWEDFQSKFIDTSK